LLTLLGEGVIEITALELPAHSSFQIRRTGEWRAISKPGSLRGIYFKIDEFFRDVFQQVLAGLGYRII
jgi:hypothetical protein